MPLFSFNYLIINQMNVHGRKDGTEVSEQVPYLYPLSPPEITTIVQASILPDTVQAHTKVSLGVLDPT